MSVRTLLIHAHAPERVSYFDDWFDAFMAEPRLDVVPANLATAAGHRTVRRTVRDVELVIVLHSAIGDSLDEISRSLDVLGDRGAPLVTFIGNEVSLPHQPFAAKLDLLRQLEPNIVATQLLLESAQYLYEEIPGARVLALPHALNPDVFRAEVAPERRPVDIGFRGAEYLPYVGDNDRNRIIGYFANEHFDVPLAIDVRTNFPFDRDGWSAFLNQCKGTIGAEAGSVYMTRDDSILERAETEMGASIVAGPPPPLVKRLMKSYSWRVLRRRPDTSTVPKPPAPAQSLTMPEHGAVSGKTISSRHFDAIGALTCQILFRGRYGDILEPDRHYLALERDFSNIDDVLARFLDDTTRNRLVRDTREWAMANHTYRHRVDALLVALGLE